MKYRNKVYALVPLLLTISLLVACDSPESAGQSLLIPIGRSAVVGGNPFQVLIDSEPHHPKTTYDNYGGYWHPLDLTFTKSFDLSDIRYLDLIYSSEENPLYEQSRSGRYSPNANQIIVYDTTQRAYDGRLGFRLVEDDSPNSLVVENLFILADIPSLIPQKVP